jgi:hypothetical protein
MIQEWFAYFSYGCTIAAFFAGAIGAWWAMRKSE